MTKKKPEPVNPIPMTVTEHPLPTATPSLRKIREEALGRQAEHRRSNSEVITELEAWLSEIEATIAFLRAQNK